MSKQGVGRYFCFIKNKVSSDWKDLAWCLGFETPDIDNIDGKHRDDKSRCMDLLQQWYKQRGNAATIHVLIKALQDAQLQHVVDSLKDQYPELHCQDPVLPVHLQLSLAKQTSAPGQAGDVRKEYRQQIRERILELERGLFTVEVLNDPVRYRKVRKLFKKHKTLLKRALKGSVILLLTFLRQTDVDRFYHNHYREGEGTLSQQLSHILISDHLQDKVKGAQLIVRLQVKHEDYVQVRDRLGQGLNRTTSVDNLLTLPPPSRHVDRSSLSGLDLAVMYQPFTDRIDNITMLYRQVQTAVQTSKQAMRVQLQTLQGQVHTGRQGVDAMMKEVKMLKEEKEKAEKILLEKNEKIQELQEANKSMEARIEDLQTAKQPMESGSQQKDPPQPKSDEHSMDKFEATSTGQVKQSAVQAQGKDTGADVRFIRVGRPWVRKVSFGAKGSGRGEFNCPSGVAVSQDNEIYIADRMNSRIQVEMWW
ncbi:Hypp9197 [Branchiostoma lanceolatum]|uniref:Hypp9197 protein n=1 Tax=Branchiostoma lanceolatum TaxID=7740 RepID=A0A8J9ZE30_BRALA|nr:Hypp9197 [Branchiostoma lanceolatum]